MCLFVSGHFLLLNTNYYFLSFNLGIFTLSPSGAEQCAFWFKLFLILIMQYAVCSNALFLLSWIIISQNYIWNSDFWDWVVLHKWISLCLVRVTVFVCVCFSLLEYTITLLVSKLISQTHNDYLYFTSKSWTGQCLDHFHLLYSFTWDLF